MVRQLGAVPPISIHALREEGDRGTAQCTQAGRSISIHALREEGDEVIAFSYAILQEFLSTPSARRATTKPYTRSIIDAISIHALREEGDFSFFVLLFFCFLFLSTPSARRATYPVSLSLYHRFHFYPRPPRGGRPCQGQRKYSPHSHFYPRPPRGGRPTATKPKYRL